MLRSYLPVVIFAGLGVIVGGTLAMLNGLVGPRRLRSLNAQLRAALEPLQPGDVQGPLAIGPWWLLLRLEQRRVPIVAPVPTLAQPLAAPPSPVASNEAVRTVTTFLASPDCTIWRSATATIWKELGVPPEAIIKKVGKAKRS